VRSCGHPVPADAPAGLCPRCALATALTVGEDDAEDGRGGAASSAPPGLELGTYKLEQLLARGGGGLVYRARHTALGRTVAIKMLVGGVWADEEDRARFRAEAELAASLEHEHIVPIYEVGEHDGQPYYAMRLMSESLAAHVARKGRLAPRQAAQVVATVARAIHFGHLRGVVHRDLKPANILLDDAGRPHVGDFGVSLRLEAGGRGHRRTVTGALVGTPGYLAPEQAGAFGGDLTIAVDVWGLGAVLYELLCGAPPFGGATPAAFVRKLLEEEPVAPRQLAPELPRDLETVCLKCLEKVPERRYASALELAQELERVARGEPVRARPLSRRERVQRFARRYAWQTGVAVSLAVFLAALAAGSAVAGRAQAEELAEETLRTNAWVARSVAGAVDLELWKLREAVARAAQEPALVAALDASEVAAGAAGGAGGGAGGAGGGAGGAGGGAGGEAGGQVGRLGAALAALPAPLGEPFDSALFLDERGVCQARWPHSEGFVGRDLSFRDYAQLAGSAARGPTVVSAAFYSKADGTVRFAVAAPVFVGERRAGVLAATLRSDSTLGALSLSQDDPVAAPKAAPPRSPAGRAAAAPGRASWGARSAILLSRHGPEEPGAAAALAPAALAPAAGPVVRSPDEADGAWMVLVHPALPASGATVFVPAAALERLQRKGFDPQYRDRLGGRDERMLAGFAHVGELPFAVIVETPAERADAPSARWLRRILGAAALAAGIGALAAFVALALARRGAPRPL
jgi:serine/threonine-protein kinase